jgi:hypothetical protein
MIIPVICQLFCARELFGATRTLEQISLVVDFLVHCLECLEFGARKDIWTRSLFGAFLFECRKILVVNVQMRGALEGRLASCACPDVCDVVAFEFFVRNNDFRFHLWP